MKTADKVEIKIKKLEEIAEYYEFPVAVFFTPHGNLKGKTRCGELFEKAEAFNKIREILEGVK